MATLTEIARLCGTSTATVSYVLSGQGNKKRISEEKQQQIRRVAQEVGYSNSKTAQKSAQLRIGCFQPRENLENTMPNILSGINLALQFEINPVEISIYPYEYNALGSCTPLRNPKSVDVAVIFFPNTADMQTLMQHKPPIPTVIVNRRIDGHFCVSTDYDAIGALAADQAIARGGDSIVLVRNLIPHFGMNRRSQAIYNVCKSYGVDLGEKALYCDNGVDDAYELGHKLLSGKRLPKVIISIYDTVAFGMIRAFNEAGVTVGKDVDVFTVGTSYPQFFAKSTPSITVIDMKVTECAQRAIRAAIDLATGRLSEDGNIIISPEIIYRESSPIPTKDQILLLREYKRKSANNKCKAT